MAHLRCCSFYCRGWNSGFLSLKDLVDSLDLIFVQEHWLQSDHLYRINELIPDFLSVSVSGMDSGSLLCGRPFGGCAILYRKCFSYCITPLVSCSNRFCAIKIDPSGLSFLLACVYMPAEYHSSSFADYII